MIEILVLSSDFESLNPTVLEEQSDAKPSTHNKPIERPNWGLSVAIG